MPRGGSGEGQMTMVYKSNEFSDDRRKSYLNDKSTKGGRNRKENRKSDVQDSLMKFLDDCGDEDLIMSAANVSPSAKSRVSLSLSEHGSRVAAAPDLDGSTRPKRRGKKTDRSLSKAPLTPKNNGGGSICNSEHGTLATEKSPRMSLASLDFSPKPQTPTTKDTTDETSVTGSVSTLNLSDDVSRRRPRRTLSSSRPSRERDRERSSSRPRPSATARAAMRTRSDATHSHSTPDHNHRSMNRTTSLRGTRAERRASLSSPIVQGGASAAEPMSVDRHLARLNGSRRKMKHDDDGESVGGSVASARSSYSTMTTRTGKSLGLDAGPLNAFLNADTSSRRGTPRGYGSASVGPGIHPMADEMTLAEEEAFLEERNAKQEEILKLAFGNRKMKKRNSNEYESDPDRPSGTHTKSDNEDDDDDDQPMMKGQEKGMLARFKKGINKTGRVTRSTAKGTVNVVKDPKRAAKKVGGFAKDVGKEAVNMALNPKLAAKTAASLGKDVTKGTYKVTKGIGKGVAKGGIGLTKTVAMTGVNATTMVAGTVVDGAGKVVYGATGLIFKHGHDSDDDEFADYNAADLQSRRKPNVSLLDRINGVVEDSPEKAASKPRERPRRGDGLMATLVTDTNTFPKDSWDF
eukprot:Nitzschia sp. Nitz4//scaffold21_size171442//169333//171228//NITZ4_002198-RA/size171442-processed-gene-0.64-mRNA-1//-1//CDS//3329542522//5188//frame0